MSSRPGRNHTATFKAKVAFVTNLVHQTPCPSPESIVDFLLNSRIGPFSRPDGILARYAVATPQGEGDN